MIAASALLVVVALVLLVVGVFQTGLEMIFGSMAASVLAAITLIVGVLRDRKRPMPAGAGYATVGSEPSGVLVLDEDEAEPAMSDEPPTLTGVTADATDEPVPFLVSRPDADQEAPAEPSLPAAAPATRSRATARKPVAKKAAPKKAAPKKAAPKKAAPKKAAAPKKSVAKKAVPKKAAPKKAAPKKAAPRKPKPPAGG